MYLVQNNQSMISNIEGYLKSPFHESQNGDSLKKSVFILEGVLIGILVFMWLEFAVMGELYHWLYPIIISSSIVLGHYLITQFIYNRLKHHPLTVAKFWLISFAAVLFSFLIVNFMGICGVLCMVTQSYCPTIWHTSPPDGLILFPKMVLIPWLVSTFLLVQGILKQQLSLELESIKQINTTLKLKWAETESATLTSGSKDSESNIDGFETFMIPMKEGDKKVASKDIYFISVEDHYCKLVMKENGGLQEEFIRLTLKEALSTLPSHFAQIHKSYVVNLQHVSQIKKENQAYQLYIKGSENYLPASRHRAPYFLPKLKEILN